MPFTSVVLLKIIYSFLATGGRVRPHELLTCSMSEHGVSKPIASRANPDNYYFTFSDHPLSDTCLDRPDKRCLKCALSECYIG